MPKRIITSIIIVSLFWNFLSSCKKTDEPDPPNPPQAHNTLPFTDSTYYFEYQKTEYQGLLTESKDFVQQCYIENDSLKVLYWGFPITADNQTYFEYGKNTAQYIQICFSNNYGAIDITVTNMSGYGRTETYHGTITNLSISQRPHAYANDLQGLYLLDVLYKDSCIGIDTMFRDTLQISLYTDSTIIGDYWFEGLDIFHSYSNYDAIGSPFFYHKSIYWKDDSLRFYKYAIQSHTSGCMDSSYYTFQGRKL